MPGAERLVPTLRLTQRVEALPISSTGSRCLRLETQHRPV